MADCLVDAMGIPFDDARKWLPARANEVTPPKIVDKKAAGEWRWKQNAGCWWCGEEDRNLLEVHHIVRHDAPFAFAWLCADCHRHTEAAVHADSLPRLLRLKWEYDRSNTSWLHLGLGLRTHLPVELKG